MGSRQQKLRNDHNLSQGKKASKDRGERTQGLRTSTGRTARDEGVIPSAQNVGNGVCSWRWRSRAKKVWSGAGGWMQSPGMSGSRLWRFGRTGAEKEKVEGSVKDRSAVATLRTCANPSRPCFPCPTSPDCSSSLPGQVTDSTNDLRNRRLGVLSA